MRLDSESFQRIVKEVCQDSHVPLAQAAFGEPGVDAIFEIMATVQALYKHVEPSRVRGRIIVFRTVPDAALPLAPGSVVDLATLANSAIQDLTLEVVAGGLIYKRTLKDGSIEDIAKSAVVYHYSGGKEEFAAGPNRKFIPRLDPSALSQFSIPTLFNVGEALQQYASESVRESTCYLFDQIWFDDHRLFLKVKPEATMRRSLTQYLRNRLGADHDVWPEQNVNEKNPVDIRIKPRFANNRLVLIEIKWLGYSMADDGHITVRYANARAQEGADQLAEYLDEQIRFAPSDVIHGYYVIIDARRKHLAEGTTLISRENGKYFEDKELTFAPAQHKVRADFNPPYRMFSRPVCAD